MMMSRKKSLITFAVVGLLAGAATYLLLGTDEGKKQLKKAKKQIRDLSDEVASKSRRGYERASSFAEKAGNEVSALANKARSRGNDLLDEAEDTVQNIKNQAKKA